ncbi:MAG: hypothetical protein ACPGRX_02180 [Bdellovibrionales bacterium]
MRLFICFILTLYVSGCAYVLDGAHQEVTIKTPGANGAVCYLYVEGLRYEMYPPQTRTIFKSKDDLVVDCLAPGNRRKTVYIESAISENAPLNIGTGGAGAVYDFASGAMFKYPAIIEVDFTHAAVRPEPLPAQNQPDIRQPEDYPLEEFLPSAPRLNSDRSKTPVTLQKRATAVEVETNAGDSFAEPADLGHGKGDLQSVLDTYGSSIDPSGDKTPAFPGQ